MASPHKVAASQYFTQSQDTNSPDMQPAADIHNGNDAPKQHVSWIRSTAEKIASVLTQHEEDAAKFQQAQYARLAGLLKRKVELEGEMEKAVRRLRRDFQSYCYELTIITDGRIEDLGVLPEVQ